MPRSNLRHLLSAAAILLAACGGESTSPPPPPPPVTVASVDLTPPSLNLLVGQSSPLTAVARSASGQELAGRTITFASSADAIATVNSSGLVTAVAQGTATITATAEGKSAQAAVTVAQVPVASIDLTPATLSVVIGRSGTLTAVARAAGGQELAGRPIVWTSSANAVATVSATGVVTAVGLGTTTITAATEGKSAQAAVTVIPVPVASVTIGPDTVSLKLAETRAFSAVVKDDLGNVLTDRIVRWSTSSSLVAKVDSLTGVVLAEDDGNATITATVEGKSGTARVRVYSPVASVVVNLQLDTLEAYDIRQMQVVLKDAKGRILTGRQVSWQISDQAVATLDQVGLLTGVDRGTVTVTATSEGISGTAKRVVVIKYRSLSVGWMHACDLASGGIAWCWGLNGREGRIGMASMADNVTSAIPVLVPGNHRFVQLSVYQRHTCALKADGAAYCWGYNGSGQLGAAVGAARPAPVAVTGGIAFKLIAAGGDHTCGLDLSGKAYCWGNNSSGQLGDGTNTLRTSPVAVTGGLLFSSISAGTSTTCAVAVDGALFCWGQNSLGSLGAGGSLGGLSTIPLRVVGGLSASRVKVAHNSVCAITAGGQGYCWGGQTASGAAVQTSTPLPMAGGLSYGSLSQGASHGCGTTTSNDIYCWGHNGQGQLGIPGNVNPMRPTLGGGGLKAIDVDMGFGTHTCSVSTDRLTVYCFGQNDVGQLGNGIFSPQAGQNATPSIVVSQKPLPPS